MMKCIYLVLATAIVFSSCQKDYPSELRSAQSIAISADAVAPLPCNTTAFASDYPIVPGYVPPFRYTKTLDASGRVKTINMLTRVYPIFSTYKRRAYELIGTFSYWTTNDVRFVGTRETWEYYKTSTGAGARRSIEKKSITYHFKFNNLGYCRQVDYLAAGADLSSPALRLSYGEEGEVGAPPHAVTHIAVGYRPDGNEYKHYYPTNDKYGNNLSYDLPYNAYASRVSYVYDYAIPRGTKRYSFIPTQNLISQEYSLLEVMGWLPQPSHQRKSVSGIFYPYTSSAYPYNAGEKVVQSQTYRNYKFDSRGNQVSLTYNDNVLQKTTWACR